MNYSYVTIATLHCNFKYLYLHNLIFSKRGYNFSALQFLQIWSLYRFYSLLSILRLRLRHYFNVSQNAPASPSPLF